MADRKRIVWVKKMPAKRNDARERVLAQAKRIAARPGKWAVIGDYPDTDTGRNSANMRAKYVRRKNSAWALVGVFQATVRYDPDFGHDRKPAWLVIVRCIKKHDTTKRAYMAWEYTTDGEEATDGEEQEEREGLTPPDTGNPE